MLRALLSVLAAMFGVQSSKNSTRDLHEGKIGEFIIAGLIGVMLFVGVIYLVVKLVLIKNGI